LSRHVILFNRGVDVSIRPITTSNQDGSSQDGGAIHKRRRSKNLIGMFKTISINGDDQKKEFSRSVSDPPPRKRGRPTKKTPPDNCSPGTSTAAVSENVKHNESAGKDISEHDSTVVPHLDAGKYLLKSLLERSHQFLDTLNYTNANQRCISALFPLQIGKGNIFPPVEWHCEGQLIRHWRNMTQELQERHTQHRLDAGLAFDHFNLRAGSFSISALKSRGSDALEAMDFSDSHEDTINALFKLRVGGGNFHPPRVYLKSGILVQEWRKMSRADQTSWLRQYDQLEIITVSPQAQPLSEVVPEKDGSSYQIRGLKMMSDHKRDGVDFRNTSQHILNTIFPYAKTMGKLPPPPFWRCSGSAIREWRQMSSDEQIKWILDEEIGDTFDRQERRQKRHQELIEEEQDAMNQALAAKTKKANIQPPGPCQGITLRTIDVFKGKNKEMVADGFFHMLGEAMNERSVAYASRAPWPYSPDILGILPDLQKKSDSGGDKETTVRFILRQTQHHPIDDEPARYCSFHSVDCSGTEERTGSGRILAVGRGMCKNCRLGRNNFFSRAEGTSKLYRHLKPQTSNARVAKSPHLLSLKLHETTKKLKTLSNRLYARTQRENAKANAALHTNATGAEMLF